MITYYIQCLFFLCGEMYLYLCMPIYLSINLSVIFSKAQVRALPILRACSVSAVLSDSLRPHGLYPARLLRLWDSPDKNAGVGGHFLLQGIFSTHRWNTCLLPWQVDSWPTKLTEKPLSLSLIMYHLKFFLEAEL